MEDNETDEQYCLIELEGANPDSVKEVWLDPKSSEPTIKYRIDYPSRQDAHQ